MNVISLNGNSHQWVVAYARIVEDKREGVFMQGVYFGGLADTIIAAKQIARDCINTARGGTIIPKLFEINSGDSILPTLDQANRQFSKMETMMLQAEDIYERGRHRSIA